MKRVWAILLVVVLLITVTACGGEKVVWSDMVLGEVLPKPPSDNGEVHTNSSERLWLDIDGLSAKQFNDYITACKEQGFTVEAESSSYSYTAYNVDGYKVHLSHYGDGENMGVTLEAPMAMDTIMWPVGAAGKKLPIPKSTIGKISYEYDDNFSLYLGDTTKAEFVEYANACAEKGFTVNYSKGDDYYFADDSEGWTIELRYEGNNVMRIYIDGPDDDGGNIDISTTTKKSTATSTTTTTKAADDKVGTDFKKAMDSYEDFMNEYVAFMKKYSANPTDMGLLADYADYMSKYADFVEDFEKWEDEEMNAAEAAYYLEVQTRVNKKLLEVAY